MSIDIFGTKEISKRLLTAEKEILRLNKFDSSINNQFALLKDAVADSLKRSPEFEKEARSASKKASECRNKALDTLQAISTLLDQVTSQKNEIIEIKSEVNDTRDEIDDVLQNTISKQNEIDTVKDEIFTTIHEIKEKIKDVTDVFNQYPELNSSLEELNDFVANVEENNNKSSQLLKSITSRKNEIDNIYREIYGFDQRNDENDEVTHIGGLKEELEAAYDKLQKQSVELTTSISEIQKDASTKFTLFVDASKSRSEQLITEWEKKHSDINKKIQSLLPNALTAGLSYAFSEKKIDEDKAYEKYKTQFRVGIIGLIIVSAIPFILSIIFLIEGKDWDIIIDRIPRIVLAIIPLYLPVLWLAFSSSKKMNLSKRLIEEYSHKEVLSKTFEGLSSQIDNLDDESISAELRIKLLQNFMQVYSENPGKLISNYETSDHPLMEVLDQSYKLESAVEKLKKIPGLEKVSKILENKSDKILAKGEEMVEKGLSNMEKIEGETNSDRTA